MSLFSWITTDATLRVSSYKCHSSSHGVLKKKICSWGFWCVDFWVVTYRVFNHATDLVEETYDVEFDESNGSQGAHENLDDVGDEPLREAMKMMYK